MKLSLAHAKDIAKNGLPPSHTSTKGIPFQQRVANAGIIKCAAENLSLGNPNPVLSLILLFLDEGVPDLGHRNTLLNPYYTEIGIGISKHNNSQVFVVQDFSCAQSIP